MPVNAILRRAVLAKCLIPTYSDKVVFSYIRKFSNRSNLLNLRIGSSYSTSLPLVSSANSSRFRNDSFDFSLRQRHNYFIRNFSTQPSPKPSGSTLGLADQVLMLSFNHLISQDNKFFYYFCSFCSFTFLCF